MLLNPDWVTSNSFYRLGMGLAFDCPLCPPDRFCRFVLWFDNPVDGLEPITAVEGLTLYWRRGSELPGISLSPVIQTDHWGGLLSNGNIYIMWGEAKR